MPAAEIRVAQQDLTLARRRPLGPPPADIEHEWLSEWLPSDATEVRRWCEWFITTHVAFKLVVVPGCPMRCTARHHHVYEWAMVYVHRIITPRNAKQPSRWCCPAVARHSKQEARHVSPA